MVNKNGSKKRDTKEAVSHLVRLTGLWIEAVESEIILFKKKKNSKEFKFFIIKMHDDLNIYIKSFFSWRFEEKLPQREEELERLILLLNKVY